MLSTKQIRYLAFLSITVISSTGCQHARSFLHMDSNSPSPFLGLELSVDAKSAQQKDDRNAIRTVSLTSVTSDEALSGNSREETADHQFVSTSESLEHSGNLKFSLPAMELKAGSSDAEEVDAIMSRFSGS